MQNLIVVLQVFYVSLIMLDGSVPITIHRENEISRTQIFQVVTNTMQIARLVHGKNLQTSEVRHADRLMLGIS